MSEVECPEIGVISSAVSREAVRTPRTRDPNREAIKSPSWKRSTVLEVLFLVC
ncbi:hypothetical protein ZHAS_00004934 [Anopheles sinensis]|uniref:Uncharacterized protein n=1 Tax=Anopheles sinensis TaxID=74873 RepID=A0A084VI91_ANOSI|nr:hypothetical protein ZHAS_00004934 [Anopheles sinensis]